MESIFIFKYSLILKKKVHDTQEELNRKAKEKKEIEKVHKELKVHYNTSPLKKVKEKSPIKRIHSVQKDRVRRNLLTDFKDTENIDYNDSISAISTASRSSYYY